MIAEFTAGLSTRTQKIFFPSAFASIDSSAMATLLPSSVLINVFFPETLIYLEILSGVSLEKVAELNSVWDIFLFFIILENGEKITFSKHFLLIKETECFGKRRSSHFFFFLFIVIPKPCNGTFFPHCFVSISNFILAIKPRKRISCC
jgi:hypothetical protein